MNPKCWPAVVVLLVTTQTEAPAAWPTFLPPRDTFTPGVAASIERVWANPTLVRSVEAEPARVPLRVYLAFVDVPDVTAAAARHLKLAKYQVRLLDQRWYEADDHDGARGIYHVAVRDGARRVILSWGSHRGALLGTIRGSALTAIELEDRGEFTGQRLTAYVLIDNPVAARLARVLVTIFGGIADRKLTEGFTVTARVAIWARERRQEFCDWLNTAAVPAVSRQHVLAALPECPGDRAAVTPRDP